MSNNQEQVTQVEVLGTTIQLETPASVDEVVRQLQQDFPILQGPGSYQFDPETGTLRMDQQAGSKG